MAKVKVRGKGSVYKMERGKSRGKCRKWQLRVPVGLDPRTGKYKTRTRRFNGTYTEAKKALREFIKEIENDEVHKRSGTTIKECAEDFMTRRRASGEFTENTNVTYERFFRAINRHIGYADASKVTRETLEKMYAAMRSAGASLWRLTKPPFLPRMGDSFFREERSKGRTKSTGADFVRGRLFAAHPATPEIGKKMLPASKIPGGYSRPMPRLCRGEFYGQRASENSGNFP